MTVEVHQVDAHRVIHCFSVSSIYERRSVSGFIVSWICTELTGKLQLYWQFRKRMFECKRVAGQRNGKMERWDTMFCRWGHHSYRCTRDPELWSDHGRVQWCGL